MEPINKMTHEEAHKIVIDASTAYRGTLKEHMVIQQALDVLKPEPDIKTDLKKTKP